MGPIAKTVCPPYMVLKPDSNKKPQKTAKYSPSKQLHTTDNKTKHKLNNHQKITLITKTKQPLDNHKKIQL